MGLPEDHTLDTMSDQMTTWCPSTLGLVHSSTRANSYVDNTKGSLHPGIKSTLPEIGFINLGSEEVL